MTTTTPHSNAPAKHLHRSDNRIIAGVCSGIADYLGLDVTLVRVIAAVLTVFGGGGILVYLVAWLVMPDARGSVIAARAVQSATSRRSNGGAADRSNGSTVHEPPAE